MIFNEYLKAKIVRKHLTKRDYDKDRASTIHYDEYKLFKLLIMQISGIYYYHCYLWLMNIIIYCWHDPYNTINYSSILLGWLLCQF